MASNVGDKVLWTAIILSGIAAYWYIPYVLHQVKDTSAITVPQPKPNKPQLEKDAEAAIKTSTLAELADGPSYNLTASAIRLTASKFFKSNAKQILLKDLASKDHDRRDKAINALNLLLTNTALKENSVRSQFTDDITFNYLVTALVNLLPEHDKAPKSTSTSPPLSPIRPATRSAHESALLYILNLLINEPRKLGNPNRTFYVLNAQPAINAGIITRWLKHYPFPCTLPENRRWNYKRHDIVRLLREDEWGSDDESMSVLVNMLVKSPGGARQLADVGLQTAVAGREGDRSGPSGGRRPGRGYDVRVDDDDEEGMMMPRDPIVLSELEDDIEEGEIIDDEEMIARLSQSGRAHRFSPWHDTENSDSLLQSQHQPDFQSQAPSHLRSGRTAGERSLRRRHRQAIVVAEAGMPLREENILQRQPTETELNWQEEIERGDRRVLLERIDGVEGVVEGPRVPPEIEIGEGEGADGE